MTHAQRNMSAFENNGRGTYYSMLVPQMRDKSINKNTMFRQSK